jgi:lipopolysaccharide assembly protein A
MRMICLLILLIILAAIGIFAVQNQEPITLHYLQQSVSCPLALLMGIVYLLGMVSGGTVFALVRHSLRRVTERPSA